MAIDGADGMVRWKSNKSRQAHLKRLPEIALRLRRRSHRNAMGSLKIVGHYNHLGVLRRDPLALSSWCGEKGEGAGLSQVPCCWGLKNNQYVHGEPPWRHWRSRSGGWSRWAADWSSVQFGIWWVWTRDQGGAPALDRIGITVPNRKGGLAALTATLRVDSTSIWSAPSQLIDSFSLFPLFLDPPKFSLPQSWLLYIFYISPPLPLLRWRRCISSPRPSWTTLLLAFQR